jgi:signal transduction histidine kinase
MQHPLSDLVSSSSNYRLLLAYVTDLELEVDRLRQQGQFVQQEVRGILKRIGSFSAEAAADQDAASRLRKVRQAATHLAAVVRDLQELPGYHPAHNQVVAIAVRPLIEQVFRWQQRLVGARQVALRLRLEIDHVEWFPARLRHILDNLLSNALRYCDPEKAEGWVQVELRASPASYELRILDNGVGMSAYAIAPAFDLFYRAAPARAAGLGVGLAVVKMLVEQSGGALTVESEVGRGTTFSASLPRFDLDDYLV